MPTKTMDLDDLRRILVESAGVDPDVSLDGDIHDVEFQDLGYDSVAVMEVVARVNRDYGVNLGDGVLSEATTPRRLLDAVNGG